MNTNESAPRADAQELEQPKPEHPLKLEKLRLRDGLTRQFALKIIQRTQLLPSGCLEWRGGQDDDGYGIVQCASVQWRVHRFVYSAWVAEISAGLFVLHACDNPPCCLPSHLFSGTCHDNWMDCIKKGRALGPRGELNGQHKLKAEQVLEIRNRYVPYSKNGNDMYDLAKDYGVSPTTIHEIIHRDKWKHVI